MKSVSNWRRAGREESPGGIFFRYFQFGKGEKLAQAVALEVVVGFDFAKKALQGGGGDVGGGTRAEQEAEVEQDVPMAGGGAGQNAVDHAKRRRWMQSSGGQGDGVGHRKNLNLSRRNLNSINEPNSDLDGFWRKMREKGEKY